MSYPGPGIARRQSGVFTAAQARAEGFPDRVVRRRIEKGRWVYVAGRALALPAERWSAQQLATAARLTLPRAVISHRTAGGIHGFPLESVAEQVCDVIHPARRRPVRAIEVHALRLSESEVWEARGDLRLTDPVRTGLDLLATLPFGEALDLYAWLSTRQVLTRKELGTAIDNRFHWYGIAQLRRLEALTAGGAISHAEYKLHEILTTAGIKGWVANATVSDRQGRIGVVDLLFEKARVVIEVDGFGAHSSRDAFQRDRTRQNRLVAAGYTVLRFTWNDLVRDPAKVIALVLAKIR